MFYQVKTLNKIIMLYVVLTDILFVIFSICYTLFFSFFMSRYVQKNSAAIKDYGAYYKILEFLTYA